MENLKNIKCAKCESILTFHPTDKEGIFKGVCPECGYEEWRAFVNSE